MTADPRTLMRDFDFRVAGKWLGLGALVGAVGGAAAIVLQTLLQLLTGFFLGQLAGVPVGYPGGEPPLLVGTGAPLVPWLVVLLPGLGGLLCGLLTRFAPEAAGAGADAAIQAYHRNRGMIRGRVPLVKILATALTIGTGGSGGREGPIAQIGAGFGSFLAVRLGLSTRTRRWLLAAGIGAGVGSLFRAPLAGALFAAEVLYSSADVEAEVLLPATVSSIVAYSVYSLRFGWGSIFSGAGHYGFANPLELLPYLGLALAMAMAALLYIKLFHGAQALFRRLPLPSWLCPALGGLLTGACGLALLTWQPGQPVVSDVLAGGYGIIQQLLATDAAAVPLGILLLVGFGKMLTTASSIGSGGSGGVFGPSMVIGATLGGAVGKVFHLLLPGIVQHPGSYAIVGMAGFFAAAANTPLSTVIMVGEVTGNYELLMPAMWVCAVAFLVSKRWSLFRSQVPSRLWSPAHFGEYAREMVAGARVADVVKRSRRFVQLGQEASLAEVLQLTAATRQRLFPVVAADGRLVGTFGMDDLSGALHDPGLDPTRVRARELAHPRFRAVRLGEPVLRAQSLMRELQADELLVVEDADPRRAVGILTGADILLAYTREAGRRQQERAGSGELPALSSSSLELSSGGAPRSGTDP